MKKSIGPRSAVYPEPVFIIATYNEDGSANAMNAAWGGIANDRRIMVCIDRGHKTAENLRKRKAFTIGIAEEDHVVPCDYLGVVSGNDVPDKMSKSGFHTSASDMVDAPIIDELRMCLECRVISYDEVADEMLIGEIVDIKADDSILTDGNIDPMKLRHIVYDPINHDYISIGEKVGKAHSDGKKLI